MKELEYFHFDEMSFHRNDSQDKVADYCTIVGVHFEYTKFWDKDEEIFSNAQNMTALRRRFKQKITMVGGKGKVFKQKKKQEEEASKKRQEEALRLSQDTKQWLVAEEEEKIKSKEEAKKRSPELNLVPALGIESNLFQQNKKRWPI